MKPVRFAPLVVASLLACRAPEPAPTAPPIPPPAIATPATPPAPAPQAAVATPTAPTPPERVYRPDWGDPSERPRVYDLVNLRFDVDFDLDRRRIAAEATNLVVPLRDGLGEIGFDAEQLVVSAATVDGVETTFRTEPKKIVVALPRPSHAGERLAVAIRYEAEPVKGLHWVGPEPGYPEKAKQVWSQGQAEDNHFWIPTWDFPNDKASWECRLTCPADLTAVSNGVLVGTVEGPRPGTKTFHWKMEAPNSTYLIAVAVGPWERYADDFRGKPVEYFVARGVGEETARRSFGQTPDMLGFFSDFIGVEYAWPKYAQVAVSEFVVGGMENVSCTLQTDRTLHDARAHLDADSEGLVAHELAHQWWGDLLTCRDWTHLWLNEGFATYFQVLYDEHAHGTDAMRSDMRGQQRGVLGADSAGDPRPMVEEFFSRKDGRGSNHVYTKGASVLHMLRFVLGDDLFRRAIHRYASKHAGQNVDTGDFRRAIAEETGDPLEWFFEEWVLLAGHPKFEVTASWDEAAKTETLLVRQTQKVGGLVPTFRMPVDLKFVVGGKKEVRRVWVSEAEHRFEFPLPARPSLVRFDDGGWLLKTLKFEKPIEEWIFQIENDDDLVGRIEAAEALGELSLDARATRALARALGSKDFRAVRTACASELGKRKGNEVAKGALLAALSDREARVRAAAADALGNFEKDSAVAEALRESMTSDHSYRTRANAVRSLKKVAGGDAFDDLVTALSVPSHQGQVASAAIDALADLDPKKALPLLLERAAYGKPYDTRLPAIRALGRIASKLPEGERGPIREVLEQGLQDRWFQARLASIRGLGEVGDRTSIARLDPIAKSERDGRFRGAAEEAVKRLTAAAEKAAARPTPVPASGAR